MLFPYTYVPHKMEKMQAFIDFIFYEVWCKAPTSGHYNLSLYNANPELCEVMTAWHYDDSKGSEFFSGHIEGIYGLFAALGPTQIDQFRAWYRANNDIEHVCANDPATSLVRYDDFPVELKDLQTKLAGFFKKLYSHLDIAALKAKIGDIDDHYQNFVQTNRAGKCPFCGINDLLGEYHSKREAYDHYLPKALYPFNSINFRNLVPACHHCNSSYKTSKDPAHKPKDPAGEVVRRKVFYPYSPAPRAIDLQVTLQHSNIEKLTAADVSLQFGPPDINEEIDTWKDVYGIEERYKAKLCGENDGKYWLVHVLEEWVGYGKTPEEYMITLTRQTNRNPYAECNFLKKPFLEACARAGLFNPI